ncbi:hypothetical protein ACEYW6_31555 [Nostoc sp. UIC 10607]
MSAQYPYYLLSDSPEGMTTTSSSPSAIAVTHTVTALVGYESCNPYWK